ncbi:MarR family winged helix-turn-helix transcriptional regulator [Cognatishimia sp. SS12]|uniref:MarR family winged helix-turn-helix transcriptional regulator n=1 Tax=Cognatishimia sp. SS12 TaxID=2979465 RepID=UPI002FEE5C25
MSPIRAMLLESGLTEQQWRVLRVLAEYGPQDATEVSEHAGLMMPSLTRIVKRMCENGLITRVKDETDGRRQTLSLTDAGHAMIEANKDVALGIVNGFKERLGPENYEILLDLLQAISQRGEH